jgi:hypothetical protein
MVIHGYSLWSPPLGRDPAACSRSRGITTRTPARILQHCSERLKLTGAGLLLGLAGAATRTLQSQLFGVSPNDPATYALAVLLLVTTALLASYVPAWRASRVEPLEALRQE